MNGSEEFCTCQDLACPLHPSNHGKGCGPCIRKNLKLREIPSCFFNMLDSTAPKEGYTFEDFAKLVLRQNNGR